MAHEVAASEPMLPAEPVAVSVPTVAAEESEDRAAGRSKRTGGRAPKNRSNELDAAAAADIAGASQADQGSNDAAHGSLRALRAARTAPAPLQLIVEEKAEPVTRARPQRGGAQKRAKKTMFDLEDSSAEADLSDAENKSSRAHRRNAASVDSL